MTQVPLQDSIKITSPQSRLERICKQIEMAGHIVTIVATVTGGFWVYFQFHISREPGSPNLVISVSPKLIGDKTDKPVTKVDIVMKNVGRRVVRPGVWERKGETGDGCELSVIHYSDAAAGWRPNNAIIDFNRGGGTRNWILEKYNVIGNYDSYRDGTYALSPGDEYRESVVVPTQQPGLYCFHVRFFSTERWTTADIQYLYVTSSATNGISQ